MNYHPGKHIIATLKSSSSAIVHYAAFNLFLNNLITQNQLQKLGEVYHNFSPEGFTAVICLSESHISIHTWPEHQLINMDIYLSNYLRNNNDLVDRLFNEIVTFFNAEIISSQSLYR